MARRKITDGFTRHNYDGVAVYAKALSEADGICQVRFLWLVHAPDGEWLRGEITGVHFTQATQAALDEYRKNYEV